jgi:hypothetical protein
MHYSHQKLTEKLTDKDLIKCQYLGGMYNISPAFNTASEYSALSNKGNLVRSGLSKSTWLVLANNLVS